MIRPVRDRWSVGDTAAFEYHCFESDESADADLWHHSHQPVTVLGDGGSDPIAFTLTMNERYEAAVPLTYRIQFADGSEFVAMEDELFTDSAYWFRPDPPSVNA